MLPQADPALRSVNRASSPAVIVLSVIGKEANGRH